MPDEEKKDPKIKALRQSLKSKDESELWDLDESDWDDLANTDEPKSPSELLPPKKKLSKLTLKELEQENEEFDEDEEYDESFFDEEQKDETDETSEEELVFEDLDEDDDFDEPEPSQGEQSDREVESSANKTPKKELADSNSEEEEEEPKKKETKHFRKTPDRQGSTFTTQRSLAREIEDIEENDNFDELATDTEEPEDIDETDFTPDERPSPEKNDDLSLSEETDTPEQDLYKKATTSSSTLDDILNEIDDEIDEAPDQQRINGFEKMLILACCLSLIGLGIFAIHYLNRDLEENTAMKVEKRNSPLPIKSNEITITHLDTYWVKTNSNSQVSAQTEIVPLCIIKAKIKGSGSLRLLFRDAKGQSYGDILNLPFSEGKFEASGTDVIKVTGTDGLKDEYQFSLLSGGQKDPWNLTITHGPRKNARADEFKEIAYFIVDSSISEN